MLSDENQFERSGLGQTIKIPQEILKQSASLLSAISILLGKSPTMLLLLYSVLVGTNCLKYSLKEGMGWLSEALGLNQTLEEDSENTSVWEIAKVLANFEDMRVNAKELEILDEMKVNDQLKNLETKRKNLVTNIFNPVTALVQELPDYFVAYVGGIMSMTGSMNSVDILGFQSALKGMLEGGTYLYTTITALWSLEDQRFEYCFKLMEMLETKATIGLDSGFKAETPTKASKSHVSIFFAFFVCLRL